MVASAQGEALVWTPDVDELLEMATAQVSRTFTQAECQRYSINPCPADGSQPAQAAQRRSTRSRDLGPPPTDLLAH